MKLTFGIISNPDNDATANTRVHQIIDSIESLGIKELDYEIIVVGNFLHYRKNIFVIRCDESIVDGRIGLKKNIITNNAKFENVVYQHDYIVYDKDFYEGFVKFNNENPNWDLSNCKQLTINGNRYHDWAAWDDPASDPGNFWVQREPFCPEGRITWGKPCLIPYNKSVANWYVPGQWWLAKRDFMLNNPISNSLRHLQAEDVHHSLKVRNFAKYRMNPYSTVRLIKEKPIILKQRDW